MSIDETQVKGWIEECARDALTDYPSSDDLYERCGWAAESFLTYDEDILTIAMFYGPTKLRDRNFNIEEEFIDDVYNEAVGIQGGGC